MFVDLDLVDYNIKRLVNMAKPSGKTIRVATKSIRCAKLIDRILKRGKGVMKGLMTYSVREAKFLADEYNMDEFYIPYPTVQHTDLSLTYDMTQKGKWICLTVDSPEHVEIISQRIQEIATEKSDENPKPIRVAIDLDMSFRFGSMQLGPHRSKCKSVNDFAKVVEAVEESLYLTLSGIMGYEGHVAGLPDNNPHSTIPNFIIRFIKAIFFQQNVKFRRKIAEYCLANEIKIEFFNGSGSGNLKNACADDAVLTEVTAGSAFLQGQLFDYFVDNECMGAFCFGLQCTRVHCDYITCQSGGFIASGPCCADKNPKPFGNPLHLTPYKDEGFGEVQTPLQIKGKSKIKGDIKVGDPLFFRPAKSGEIAEHFQEYHLKRDYKITGTAKTYRGYGHVFY